MSLPAIGRPSGGLPPRVAANNPALPPSSRRAVREEREAEPKQRSSEVLVITVEEDKDDPANLAVIFEGAGFDIENDDIILDLLDLAARTYGFKLVPEGEDEE